MKYVDVKCYAQAILATVKAAPKRGALWILTMGDDPASASYVKGKIKDCEACGVPYEHIKVTSTQELALQIFTGNHNASVGGIIVQLPLPDGIDAEMFTGMVWASKDVDGFREDSEHDECTPEGIMHLLHNELGDLTGKRALVIGRGALVGIPMVARLLASDCTVTVAHSKTKDLDALLLNNDIIISAAGKARLVDLKKCNAEIVIDVGVNRDENGKLCGDCYNFDEDYTWSGRHTKVTPVPGGIGLMTRAMLMSHMIDTTADTTVMCGEK